MGYLGSRSEKTLSTKSYEKKGDDHVSSLFPVICEDTLSSLESRIKKYEKKSDHEDKLLALKEQRDRINSIFGYIII